jgi:hypothetical protein
MDTFDLLFWCDLSVVLQRGVESGCHGPEAGARYIDLIAVYSGCNGHRDLLTGVTSGSATLRYIGRPFLAKGTRRLSPWQRAHTK